MCIDSQACVWSAWEGMGGHESVMVYARGSREVALEAQRVVADAAGEGAGGEGRGEIREGLRKSQNPLTHRQMQQTHTELPSPPLARTCCGGPSGWLVRPRAAARSARP